MKTKLPTALALIFLNATLLSAQIQSLKLKDGVERYYRPKAAGQKPWFFQQMENLFNVILPPKDQLPFGVSVAFLVGVSQYDYLSPQLPFVKNDLEDMKQFLLNQGGFDTVYVARERIVNRDLIEDYMRNKFARVLGQRDRLMFYYAGHGADNRGKTGYMQFAGARSGNFAGPQVLKINDVSDWSSEMNLDHLLFVFDCCASGLAFDPVARSGPADEVSRLIATLSGKGSRVVVTAGTADEQTFEIETGAGTGNGVFTRAFLNAATGSADKGNDGFITIDEMAAQIKTEIAAFSARNKQRLSLTPRLWPLETAQYRGTFVFVNPEAQSRRLALAPQYAEKLNARGGAAYGRVRVISYLIGKLYIDGNAVDEFKESGDSRDFDMEVGPHRLEVKGQNETSLKDFTVVKGLNPSVVIETKLPPVISQPVENKPAPSTVAPRYSLRATKRDNLSEADVKAMLRQNSFYCHEYDWKKEFNNPQGKGLDNEFEPQQGGKVVYDRATSLMWQQGGSSEYMTYEEAQAYIAQLNRERFAGFSDWRLPTLEEAMSLMEPKENSDGLYIDSKFDATQLWIWTADTPSAGRAWYVHFSLGLCHPNDVDLYGFVRVVRS